MSAPSSGRIERIDVWRGIAILSVFIHHFYLAFGILPGHLMPEPNQDWLARLAYFVPEYGYLGVKLFFVISGFCIHNSYLAWRRKNAQTPLATFWKVYVSRRFWRIYPPYLLALIVLFFVQHGADLSPKAFKQLLPHVLLVNTLFKPFFYNINFSFWSIAVEWQLYFVYPILLLICIRFGAKWAFAIGTIAAIIWQHILPNFINNWGIQHLPFYWWYEWALGLLVAELHYNGGQLFRRPRLWATGLTMALLMGLIVFPNPFLIWFLPPLLFAACLETASVNDSPMLWWEKAFCPIGIISYSFYLIHQPIMNAIGSRVGADAGVFVLLAYFVGLLAVIGGFSYVLFKIVEMPAQQIGRLFEKRLLNRPVQAQEIKATPEGSTA